MKATNTPGHIEDGQKRIAVSISEFNKSNANGKELAFLYYPEESFNNRWVMIDKVQRSEQPGSFEVTFPLRDPIQVASDSVIYLEFWVYMEYKSDFSI